MLQGGERIATGPNAEPQHMTAHDYLPNMNSSERQPVSGSRVLATVHAVDGNDIAMAELHESVRYVCCGL